MLSAFGLMSSILEDMADRNYAFQSAVTEVRIGIGSPLNTAYLKMCSDGVDSRDNASPPLLSHAKAIGIETFGRRTLTLILHFRRNYYGP